MILIADSGSTKTAWAVVRESAAPAGCPVVATLHTQGITPVHQSEADIRAVLEQELLPRLSALPPDVLPPPGGQGAPRLPGLRVFFYGSGCTTAHIPMMGHLLGQTLSAGSVEVHSDLMAAARALCGRDGGIACILGTGANSCLYDGRRIVSHTPALGYILGDEGSGAVLGRLFLNGILKDPRLAGLRDRFLAEWRLTTDDITRRVYREPMANRFLASLAPFVRDHLDHPLLRRMVVGNFRQFFRANLEPYGRRDLPAHFVGSVAFHFQEQLAEAARMEGYQLGSIRQSPLDGLVAYHLNYSVT